MRALLDVNVLIALLDAEHIRHDAAVGWLRSNIRYGWGSCPIPQNGCLRIMAQPSYPNSFPSAYIAKQLREAISTDHHRFWPDDTSLLGTRVVDWRQFIEPKQITDIYLLALAIKRKGRLVTFNSRIMSTAVVRLKTGTIA